MTSLDLIYSVRFKSFPFVHSMAETAKLFFTTVAGIRQNAD